MCVIVLFSHYFAFQDLGCYIVVSNQVGPSGQVFDMLNVSSMRHVCVCYQCIIYLMSY